VYAVQYNVCMYREAMPTGCRAVTVTAMKKAPVPTMIITCTCMKVQDEVSAEAVVTHAPVDCLDDLILLLGI